MSRQSLDKKGAEKLGLEFLDNCSVKDPFLWDSNSSNEDPIFNSKSEILWSREKNDNISQNDFFRGLQDGFSDLTEGSTSSCSWHNDDFDMNSSNKVKASLEAIEDALYEQQQSSFINKNVFQECCDWSNKFPYFRLKGEQIPKPQDDSTMYLLSSQQICNDISEPSTSSLQVEGKKMAIHAPLKKTMYEKTTNDLIEPQNCFEETLIDDGKYEDLVLDTSRDTCNKILHSQRFEEEMTNLASAKLIEDKVIESVAMEIWPKVLEILEKLGDTYIYDTNEDFQLPPIVSAIGQKHFLGRPRTEGTDAYTSDFPRLDSFLSISPKVLQSKQECASWRATQRSRPNSDIRLHCRNNSIPSAKGKHEQTKLSGFFPHQTNGNQTQFSSSKLTIQEKDENISLFLPAVNEDSIEPSNILKDFYLTPELKKVTSVTLDVTSSKKSECFLPPIDKKNYMPSNAKLTRNLFTFFGPQLKSDIHNGNRPATRPNTSASRKALKYSGKLKHKLSNEGHSSLSHSNPAEAKKLSEVSLEKPVTLFPIVTSLIPHKERNSSSGKKGVLYTFGGGRKR